MTALTLVDSPLDNSAPFPVMALAADQSTANTLRRVVADIDDARAPVLVGDLQHLIDELQVIPTPALLVVDLGDEQDLLVAASRLAEVCDPGVRVIVLGAVNDLRAREKLIAAGVSDYLLRSTEIETIRDIVVRQKSPAKEEIAVSTTAHPVDTATVLGVMGVCGGVGASTVAANLAYHDATANAAECVLIDMDLVFGTQAVNFDVDPGAGLVDAMTSPERLDDLFTKRVMIHITENLRVIAAEADLEGRHVANPAAFSQLIDHVAPHAKRVYVDFPKSLVVEDPTYLEGLDKLVLVAAPALVALRDSGRLVRWFREIMPGLEVQVILNRREKSPKQDLDRKTFAETLPHSVLAEIPADPKAVSRAESEGKCAVQSARRSKFALAIARAASALLPETGQNERKTSLSSLLTGWKRKAEPKGD